MTAQFSRGDRLKVVSTPPGKSPPFKAGDTVVCLRVTSAGSVLTDRHAGFYPATRFAPV